MEFYKHRNYQKYVKAQIIANEKKFERHWVTDVELGLLADFYIEKWGMPKNVICHGARNGFEVQIFKLFFGKECNVIGTDIAPTCSDIENMIQWDYHDIKTEWINHFDLIYSNSLDHSNYPEKAIAAWTLCLNKEKGKLVIHWTPNHNKGDPKNSDCFVASSDEYIKLIEEYGKIYYCKNINILKSGMFIIAGVK